MGSWQYVLGFNILLYTKKPEIDGEPEKLPPRAV
jgi:hypothetical protein